MTSKTRTMDTHAAAPASKKKKTDSVSDTACINTIRCLSADIVQKANSGHPGAPMGCAPIAHVLWAKIMRYSASNAQWTNRDRFVLSNGHACALVYSMLHLIGDNQVTMDQLQSFRQLGSLTAGHPENHLLDAVEVSTGPLGQGITQAVGLAIAESQLAATYNKSDVTLVDNYTYVLCGDGCLQEGISSEASSLAGHLALGKLIVLYDDNQITIDGSTELSFTEDVIARYEAYGWHTLVVTDGDSDVQSIEDAINAAKLVVDKPSLIKVKTTIGIGSSKAGSHSCHGAALGADTIVDMKKGFGLDSNQHFHIPQDVKSFYEAAGNSDAEAVWKQTAKTYAAKYPTEYAEYERRCRGDLPAGWKDKLPRYTADDKGMASRKWSQATLQVCADALPDMIGGSADLTPSNGTKLNNFPVYDKNNRGGRYIHYGVREHAMVAINNGIAAYGPQFVPFGATFLNFLEYGLGAVRVGAISHFRTIQIMTHDSIGLGEDGPTHQPIEANALLRAMPNLYFMRPGDGNEVSGCYAVGVECKDKPIVLSLSRQGMSSLAGTDFDKVVLGAYAIHNTSTAVADVVLVGTGAELGLCVEAAKVLEGEGKQVRVVSMPCAELFDAQGADYAATVFPAGVPVVSVEAMSTLGWERYSHCQIGIDVFGESAPGPKLLNKYGFSVDNVVDKAKKTMAALGKAAPNLTQLRYL